MVYVKYQHADRQVDLCVFEARLVYIEFQDSKGFIVTPCPKHQKEKKKKKVQGLQEALG